MRVYSAGGAVFDGQRITRPGTPITGNIIDHEGIGRDFCMAANFDSPNQRRAGSNIDLLANRRYAFPSHGGGSDRHTMRNVAVSSYNRLRMDDHPSDMPDKESLADRRSGRDLHLHHNFAEFVRQERYHLQG